MQRILKKQSSDHSTVTAGGTLDESDIDSLRDMGVMKLFPKGTTFEDLIEWSRNKDPQRREDATNPCCLLSPVFREMVILFTSPTCTSTCLGSACEN